jgi:hypothetical protein
MTGEASSRIPFNQSDGVSLREHLEDKINDLDKRVDLINRMNQIAVDKAVSVIDDRLTIMNEFRNAMKDQQSTFVTKAQFDIACERLKSLEITGAKIEGKASQKEVTLAQVGAALGVILGMISLFTALFGG